MCADITVAPSHAFPIRETQLTRSCTSARKGLASYVLSHAHYKAISVPRTARSGACVSPRPLIVHAALRLNAALSCVR